MHHQCYQGHQPIVVCLMRTLPFNTPSRIGEQSGGGFAREYILRGGNRWGCQFSWFLQLVLLLLFPCSHRTATSMIFLLSKVWHITPFALSSIISLQDSPQSQAVKCITYFDQRFKTCCLQTKSSKPQKLILLETVFIFSNPCSIHPSFFSLVGTCF